MRKILIILAAAVMVVSCAKKPATTEEQPIATDTMEMVTPAQQETVVNALPYDDITAITPEGNELRLSDFVGKTDYVLLDFWASWCGPCRRFIPVLKEIYHSQPEGHLQILSCSIDKDAKAWQVALDEEQMPWPQMREDDAHECSDVYNVQYIPHTVLFDREGNIVAVNPEEPDLENILLN